MLLSKAYINSFSLDMNARSLNSCPEKSAQIILYPSFCAGKNGHIPPQKGNSAFWGFWKP